MEAYRPAPPPLWKQLLVNPFFLIAITLSIVMGSVVYIRQKQREEIANRAQLIRSGPVIVERGEETHELSLQTAEVRTIPDPDMAAQNAPPSGAKNLASAANENKALTDTNGKPSAAEPKKEQRLTMTAYYTEISRGLLNSYEEESQTTNQFTDFGEFKAGALNNISAHINARGVRVLQKISKPFDGKTTQQQWFIGNKSADDQDVGINSLVILEPAAEDGHVRGEIEILRSFHETNEADNPVVKKSYPITNFDLPAKWGWMVFMNLPRVAQEPGSEILTEGLLRLFKMTSFMNNKDTEFTLFLEFDTSK